VKHAAGHHLLEAYWGQGLLGSAHYEGFLGTDPIICEKAYQPIINGLVTASEFSRSDWYPRTVLPVDIILSASFAKPALQQPGTIVVVALGVEVSTYPLNATILNAYGTGTMKIVECFV
jgi:hypothetical protein